MTDCEKRIYDLELSNAELRAALIVAGKEIRLLRMFRKANPDVLPLLRRTHNPKVARDCAEKACLEFSSAEREASAKSSDILPAFLADRFDCRLDMVRQLLRIRNHPQFPTVDLDDLRKPNVHPCTLNTTRLLNLTASVMPPAKVIDEQDRECVCGGFSTLPYVSTLLSEYVWSK